MISRSFPSNVRANNGHPNATTCYKIMIMRKTALHKNSDISCPSALINL